MIKNELLLLILVLTVVCANAQVHRLKDRIQDILETKNAEVGVSVVANDYQDTLIINGNIHFPMQSVFKFPIALTVLSEIDKGKISLEQKIKITKKDLSPDTWSPIKKRFPDGQLIFISVFVANSRENAETNERIIADISKSVWDYYTKSLLSN